MRSWEWGISLLRSVFFILQPSGFSYDDSREKRAHQQVRRYELYIRAIRTMEETKSIFPNLYILLSTFHFFVSSNSSGIISSFLPHQTSHLSYLRNKSAFYRETAIQKCSEINARNGSQEGPKVMQSKRPKISPK